MSTAIELIKLQTFTANLLALAHNTRFTQCYWKEHGAHTNRVAMLGYERELDNFLKAAGITDTTEIKAENLKITFPDEQTI